MAIAGLGTDIIEIARLNKSDATTERLAKRVLTPYELTLYVASNDPVRYLAKRFAAKEAAVKALGTGIGNGISWQHIEVRNNDLGAPELHFSGEFATLCKQRAITSSVISISDEIHYAVATVILEN
ncbi:MULTISPECIES: holo-ACP synthase [Alteromonas]|uniref:Holo-[acyl-carrier-protein] synthase n=2 Tax=Alteromonas stellipolaris TaxID=233316 RepID=A0AAW7YW45_9ALTE|nr:MULTISPECIES: holo-ACP synthase [Alteromonas]AMJ89683.1 ACP synthase [Alteromonas sp. Mac2]MBQ4828786.1 holo-ACP synthase [Alteromonas sp. MMG017]ALM91764.1 Holo-[acyl-carrier protein] synthase [Alteromonas stellipolaris LMG 21856]AMJ73382.1 ACP synthase [Alteromonas stellipolaris]AMJ85824.1 ACP synthase [Alteromonas sp. Mac1]